MTPRSLAHGCRRTFQLEPHQVRYLLETFTTDSVAEAFLIWRSQVPWWRRRLGIAPMRAGVPKTNGARRSMGPGYSLRAFA